VQVLGGKKGRATVLTQSGLRNLKHNSRVEAEIAPLLPLYQRERAAGRALALAIVVHTIGSTYRKPGALMAIASDGSFAGLLSGGCLETDLRDYALEVISSGTSRTIRYDMRGTDDALWGLGIGCEGAMQILLVRVGPTSQWQPLEHLSNALAAHRPTAVGVVTDSSATHLALGSVFVPQPAAQHSTQPQNAEIDAALTRATTSGRAETIALEDASQLFVLPLALPPRLLLLGAGPDAMPLVDLARRLGWKVTVYDHRPAYARAEHFAPGTHVVLGDPEALTRLVELDAYEAAVVMSHHLLSDLEYLRLLSTRDIRYLGLLGPPARRERLLADLGEAAASSLRPRLRSPVGLDLGGRAPESVALCIVAEIHAQLHGRRGGPYDDSSHAERASGHG
jgi:xanthine dehydrogenase accessory factor